MIIYLVRHGETDWNKEKRMAYNKNLVLNATGIKQAEKLSMEVERLDYDFVITSPFIRTMQTTEIINEKQCPVIVDNRIEERNVGILDGKDLVKEIDFYEVGNYYLNTQYEGAEDMKEFCDRVWKFIDDIKERYSDKKILIVTHRYVAMAIKAYIFGIPKDGNFKKYRTKNSTLEKYIIE